jgi:hypothetical protein
VYVYLVVIAVKAGSRQPTDGLVCLTTMVPPQLHLLAIEELII